MRPVMIRVMCLTCLTCERRLSEGILQVHFAVLMTGNAKSPLQQPEMVSIAWPDKAAMIADILVLTRLNVAYNS
jgi:hypothetical protein